MFRKLLLIMAGTLFGGTLAWSKCSHQSRIYCTVVNFQKCNTLDEATWVDLTLVLGAETSGAVTLSV
jgi:hypothetical protein